MKIEIDQSWKIEKFDKATILAFSNVTAGSIRISQKVKRQAFAQVEARFGRSKLNIFKIFAVAVVLLITKNKVTPQVIILDEEYTGNSDLIVRYISVFASKCHLPLSDSTISTGNIGKHSKAHKEAYSIFTKKKTAKYNIKESEFLNFLSGCIGNKK